MTRAVTLMPPRWFYGVTVAGAVALLSVVPVVAFVLTHDGGHASAQPTPPALVLLMEHAAGHGVIQPIATVRLLFTMVPLLMLLVTAAGATRMPRRMAIAFSTAMVGLTLWSAFEAATSLYEDPNPDEWIEVALMSITVLGIAAHMIMGVRDGLRKQREAAMISDYDALTGLLNRAGVERFYASLIPGSSVAVVMLDLNNLKTINDAGGHGAGDAHLVRVARAIRDVLPNSAAGGRWGGDEYVLLLPGSVSKAVSVVARLQAMIPKVGGLPAFAAGVATCTAGDTLERSLALADAEMYQAKEQQREGVTDFGERTAGFEAFAEHIEALDNPGKIIQAGFTLSRELLGFDTALYFTRRGERFVLSMYDAEPASSELDALQRVEPREGVGLCGEAISTGNMVWTHDYPNSPYADSVWVGTGLKSCLVVPVRDRGEVVGFFRMLTFSAWRPVTPQMRRAAQTMALRLGHVLERERVLQELRDTLEGGMLGLGLALEARDMETAGHTQRVTDMAVSLGCSLGLSDEALEGLRQGAYLHDIGKLTVPDAVLLKPGKLDDAEWAIMKTHTVKGATIASRIPKLSTGALTVVRYHHEHWNGCGYPDGLRGEAIPQAARIFAVCDVFDALTSVRPYKRAWLQAEALAEIEAQAGQQFDPAVVRAFVRLMNAAGIDSSEAFGKAVA